MKHKKFNEIVTLVKHNIPVLLTGEKGSGKTTLAMQVAEHLNLPFYSMSMTRQTTLSHLLGFINVNGTYIPSHIRTVCEKGGVILLDEIDAADPNVLLSLNTIENGYITFPDKRMELHKKFRLMATANPSDNHKAYTGRTILDASTLDRFDQITVETDTELERQLVDKSTYQHIKLIRECLEEYGTTNHVSMRDSLRYFKRKQLNLLDSFVDKLFSNNIMAKNYYEKKKENLPKHIELDECETLNDIWNFLRPEQTK